MFVISFNICLFIYFSVKYAIQSNDCDVFVNKQSISISHLYLYHSPCLTESIIMYVCVCKLGCNSHSHLSSQGGGRENTLFRQNWYLLPCMVKFPWS